MATAAIHWHDVREVRFPPAGRVHARQASPEGAAEPEHEHQQEHHRPHDGEN